MSLRIALVEDDPGLRRTLAALIEAAPEMTLIAAWPTAEDALRAWSATFVDVFLCDLRLPGKSGCELIAQLHRQKHCPPIIVVTTFDDDDLVFSALQAGACGYLLKRTAHEDLIEAIRLTQRGGAPMSPEIARKVVGYFHRRQTMRHDLETLTPREREVLEQLAKGYVYKEIADHLKISLDTVRNHLRRVYEKLQVHSRTEAVAKYLGG